jgi:class 3 adenylate cyclase
MIPVICASCGADNDAGRKFCLECGTPLAAACPACGSPNPPAARFCGECGAHLAGTAGTARPAPVPARPAASPARAVAERRVVSVLFADLVGFTTIAEARDAEEVRDLLSRYFDLARGIVERHGGTIEKFIGDAVMAVWARRPATRTTPSAPCGPPWRSSAASADWARWSTPAWVS